MALDSDRYYLQWQPQDLAETAAAWTVLALMFGIAIFRLWPRSSRWTTCALTAVALVPLMSFGGGLARQLPFDDALRGLWESAAVRLGVPALVVGGFVAAVVWWPSVAAIWLRRVLLTVSPVSLVVLLTVARSASGRIGSAGHRSGFRESSGSRYRHVRLRARAPLRRALVFLPA